MAFASLASYSVLCQAGVLYSADGLKLALSLEAAVVVLLDIYHAPVTAFCKLDFSGITVLCS